MTAVNASRLYADRFVYHALKHKVTAQDVRIAHDAFLDLEAAVVDNQALSLELIRALRRAVGGEDTATRCKAQPDLEDMQVELDL